MLPSFIHKRGKLQPAWRFSPEGTIWRVVLTSSGRIFGEARNPEKKTVSFFAIDASNGKHLWSGVNFGEQWWIGIEGVSGETVFLHKYATPSMPEHKSIIAVDARQGNVLWLNDDLRFECIAGNSLLASRSTVLGPTFHVVNIMSGSVESTISESEALQLRRTSASESAGEKGMPVIVAHLEDTEEWADLIRRHSDEARLIGSIEYMQFGSLVIFACHEQEPANTGEPILVDSSVRIADKTTATLLYEGRLATGSPSIVSDSFLLHDTMLIYVSERTTLTAIDLQDMKPS
ncbi:MAG: DUF4905 domain-containing protein [Bacteroidetes bacterium]|nr:DUF4905 domain-containing protein [Bacteroidota bacterium]MCW5894859.1 DUF4905 domain-containing protein [Bacteroidota bacterium]